METTFALDWLSFTVKGITDVKVSQALAFGWPYEAWTPVKAVHGYKTAKQHPLQHIVMSNAERPDMGCHVMMTGQCMTALAEKEYDTLALIPWAIGEGARISRLDLAIDVRDVEVDIAAIAECPQERASEGSAKKWSVLQNNEGGTTLYVGSRQSEKFFRIYNKAAQMKLPGQHWTRFELELKGETARTIAAAIAGLKRDEIAAYTKGLMRGVYNPTNGLYQLVMDAPAINVASTKQPSDKTLDWLYNSVAKTLARMIRLHHEDDVIETFLASVRANVENAGMRAADSEE